MQQVKDDKQHAQNKKVDSYLVKFRSKTCCKLSQNKQPSSPQFLKGETK